MDEDKVLEYCDQIDALTQKIRDEIDAEPEIEFQPIHAGDDLQAALDVGGPWQIDSGVNFENAKGYRTVAPDVILRGSESNEIQGGTSAAVTIPMGVTDVVLENLKLQVTQCEVAVQVGSNSSDQNTMELAPSNVILKELSVTGHRGKRSIEVNAADVEINNCSIFDSYDPEGSDSQAIWIGNAPGPVTILDSYLEAASETVMVGGDKMKIPNCRPTGITILRTTLTKKIAWKDAGTPKVKNLFELKDGNDVLIDDCDLYNCWKSAQDGYCYTFTPSQGGSLRNVVVKNNRVYNVGSIVNITGTDASNINPDRSQISFLGGEYRTNSDEFGGRGIFALVGRGPEWLIIEDLFASIDGPSFIDIYDPGVDLLRITGSTWNYGSYGIRLEGYSHGDNQRGTVQTIVIEGNTITGAHSQFRNRYPNNTYLEAMTAEVEARVAKEEGRSRRELDQEVERVRKQLREDSRISS